MSKRRQLRSNRFLPEYVSRFKDRHGKDSAIRQPAEWEVSNLDPRLDIKPT